MVWKKLLKKIKYRIPKLNCTFIKNKIIAHSQHIETQLTAIGHLAALNKTENDQFAMFLKQLDNASIDALVFKLNAKITPQIDCTSCGNCCKSLMIVVEEKDCVALAKDLAITAKKFKESFIEEGSNGMMLMNTIPCNFLEENKCNVYKNRPLGCREFPAMDVGNFNDRLFTTFMHYDRCPIIFNIIEQLKHETGFQLT